LLSDPVFWFEHIFSFHVMEESYGALPEYEKQINNFAEKMLIYEREKLGSYEIFTEDSIISVFSYSQPTIRKLYL